MKNFRKFTSAMLAILMALLTTNVYAAETTKKDELTLNEISNLMVSDGFDVSNLQLSFNNCKTTFELDAFASNPIEAVADNSAETKENNLLSVLSDTGNTPPVAGLSYMVANQDTLLNGSFTTETIIYWLWNNGTTDYTYDPDGDEITGRFLGGINEYVLGNVTIGDKVVGFATKFDVAAQHELIYYVQDEHGAYSDILKYKFVVEAADGNRRPICLASVDNSSPIPEQKVKFDWSESYDPDGESLSSIRVRVYDSEGNEEIVGASSKYYAGMSGSYIQLKFDQVGQYTIRIEVADVNNNWSNWYTSVIQVCEATILKNVTWTSDTYNLSNGLDWGDYAQSINYAKSGTYSAEEVYSLITQTTKPSVFDNKRLLGVNWTVSGYAETESGTPISNETVIITVPMPIGEFKTKVSTDSNGYFTYTCNKSLWYNGWPESARTSVAETGITSDWCLYGRNNTTTWLYGTKLIVKSAHSQEQQKQSFDVIATTGSSLHATLGDRWLRNKYGEWESAY